jgi:hypothetical protein
MLELVTALQRAATAAYGAALVEQNGLEAVRLEALGDYLTAELNTIRASQREPVSV